MVRVYVNLIQKGVKSIEDVPEQIRKDVQAVLDQQTADQDCFFITTKGGGNYGSRIRNFNH